MFERKLLCPLVVVMLATVNPAPVSAQGWMKRVKDAAKEAATRKSEQDAANAAGSAIDAATGKVKCLVTDSKCVDAANASGKGSILVDDKGNPVSNSAAPTTAASAAPAATSRPGEGAWTNYDFVPGDRPIFVEDFSADRVGNFPKRLEFKSGNMEIVEWQGERWLKSGGGDVFIINLPEKLPEMFTMEFDLAGSGNGMSINFASDNPSTKPRIDISTDQAWLWAGPVEGNGQLQANTSKTPVKIRISVDGSYLKLYANEHRALNVPNANIGRSNKIAINLNGWSADKPRMIGNIRIAAGGKKLYDALASTGRVATHGIFFATGSAEIQGESTPTLNEIGDMLKAHPDLNLLIEGHTDNVGAAAANQTLSEQRAAAVKQFLVTNYGVNVARLEAKGFGATKPVASNDTPEGRQNNRRVELVKKN